MKAIYKNQLYHIEDETGDTYHLVPLGPQDFDADPNAIVEVKGSDPDLIIDPTDEQWASVGVTQTPPPRMTAEQFLEKYPESEGNENCLEDMGCPQCGQRAELRVQSTITASLYDDGTDRDESDCEYDEKSHCSCPDCDHSGTVADFTFEGLDSLIADQDDDEELEEPPDKETTATRPQ